MMTEAFICEYVRTPFGRYGGALSAVRADDLAAVAIRGVMSRAAGLDPAAIDEVLFGCANHADRKERNDGLPVRHQAARRRRNRLLRRVRAAG